MKSSVSCRWFASFKVRGSGSGWKAYEEDELELLLLEDDEDDELLLDDDELLEDDEEDEDDELLLDDDELLEDDDDDDDDDDDEDELELLPHQGLLIEDKENGVCMVCTIGVLLRADNYSTALQCHKRRPTRFPCGLQECAVNVHNHM